MGNVDSKKNGKLTGNTIAEIKSKLHRSLLADKAKLYALKHANMNGNP